MITKKLVSVLPLIYTPYEAIQDITRKLQLSFCQETKDIIIFCESISSFIMWKTQGEFSLLSIALSSLIILIEVYLLNVDLLILWDYLKNKTHLINEIEQCRLFILNQIDQITDNLQLIQITKQLATYSLMNKVQLIQQENGNN